MEEQRMPRNYGDSVSDGVRCLYRENHARQTVQFVLEQEEKYERVRRQMTMPEVMQLLNTLRDDSDPDLRRSQLFHAFQTAESIRKYLIQKSKLFSLEWAIVTGLIHDAGKGMLISFGEPQWAVVGDTFPVGCAWSPDVIFHEYFALNPDSVIPEYQTPLGMYEEYEKDICLDRAHMSWGHDEYMYRALCRHYRRYHITHQIPSHGLFIIRYHSFYAAHDKGAYAHLMNKADRSMMENWVAWFRQFDLYPKDDSEELDFDKLLPYYEDLLRRYFPLPLEW